MIVENVIVYYLNFTFIYVSFAYNQTYKLQINKLLLNYFLVAELCRNTRSFLSTNTYEHS